MNKKCEVCGNPLSGKQKRVCSIRCRNVIAGRVSGAKAKVIKIDRAWLASQYLLPPDGLGRTNADIGNELSLSSVRIQQIVKEYGLRQDSRIRNSYFRKTQPSKRKIECPSISKLTSLYLMPPEGEGKSTDDMARDFDVSRPVVERWLRECGIHEKFSTRHSKRMSDNGNPAYTNGNSQKYVARRLAKEIPKVCGWCRTKTNVQIHHINHDRGNNKSPNLMWLCGDCNRLEANLWCLCKSRRATYTKTNSGLIIEFKE